MILTVNCIFWENSSQITGFYGLSPLAPLVRVQLLFTKSNPIPKTSPFICLSVRRIKAFQGIRRRVKREICIIVSLSHWITWHWKIRLRWPPEISWGGEAIVTNNELILHAKNPTKAARSLVNKKPIIPKKNTFQVQVQESDSSDARIVSDMLNDFLDFLEVRNVIRSL